MRHRIMRYGILSVYWGKQVYWFRVFGWGARARHRDMWLFSDRNGYTPLRIGPYSIDWLRRR